MHAVISEQCSAKVRVPRSYIGCLLLAQPTLPAIIGVVSRVFAVLLPLFGFLAACGPGIKTKEQVQSAIVDRLASRTGLNLNELDVSTTSVSFDKNLAFATVAIHPKGDSNVQHGMSMKYTLEERDGKWVVLNAGGPKLGGRASDSPHSGSSNLPVGHPPVSGSSPRSPTQPEGSAR